MSARPRRDGRMKKRSERARIAPELGYYIIVTDAEKTEKHYFEGLRDALPSDLRRKIAKGQGIRVAWSNQCFEVWMSMYFGSVIRADDAQGCTSRFANLFRKATGKPYRKNDLGVYRALYENGDEDKAIERSQRQLAKLAATCSNPSQMVPCSAVHELVSELRTK